jgi:hypothetical protein
LAERAAGARRIPDASARPGHPLSLSVKTNWREGGALPGRGRSGKGQEKVKIKSHQGSTSCFAGQGPYQRTAATRSNEQAQGGNSTPVLLTHASIRA